jgi:hypothetical protein
MASKLTEVSIQASTSDGTFVRVEQRAIKGLLIVRRKWGVFVRGGVFFQFARTNPTGGPGALRVAIYKHQIQITHKSEASGWATDGSRWMETRMRI